MTSVDGYQFFGYDAINRLTSWTDETGKVTNYAFDAVGNLTQKGNQTFTYNAANEITNLGYSYDENGNMVSDGNLNYSYDAENRLVKVTKVADGSIVATYDYDYLGQRISKTTPSGTIHYHWDNNGHLVRESDSNGNTLALYTYDNKDNLLAIEKGGAIYYTHTNARGDILAITDANRNQVATYKYGPWGELLGHTGTFDQPFRYAGYYKEGCIIMVECPCLILLENEIKQLRKEKHWYKLEQVFSKEFFKLIEAFKFNQESEYLLSAIYFYLLSEYYKTLTGSEVNKTLNYITDEQFIPLSQSYQNGLYHELIGDLMLVTQQQELIKEQYHLAKSYYETYSSMEQSQIGGYPLFQLIFFDEVDNIHYFRELNNKRISNRIKFVESFSTRIDLKINIMLTF